GPRFLHGRRTWTGRHGGRWPRQVCNEEVAGISADKSQCGGKTDAADAGGRHTAVPWDSRVCHSRVTTEHAPCEAPREPAPASQNQEHRYVKGREDAWDR